MSISTTRIRRFTIVSAAALLAIVAADTRLARAAEPSPPIDTQGAASILEGRNASRRQRARPA